MAGERRAASASGMTQADAQTHNAPKRRIVGFDLIKALAMFQVIFIHYTFYAGLYPATALGQALSTFTVVGVPLFFMVNGALLMSRPFDFQKHCRRTARIVLVTMAWRVLSPFVLAPIIGQNPFGAGIRSFVSYLLFADLPGFDSLGYFWFMFALISVYLIFPLLKSCYDSVGGKRMIAVFTVCVAFLVFGLQALNNSQRVLEYYFGLPIIDVGGLGKANPLGAYAYVVVFFLLGVQMADVRGWLRERFGSAAMPLVGFVGVAAYVGLVLLQRYQQESMGIAFCVQDGYTNVLTLVMSCCIFLLCMGIERLPQAVERVVVTVGSNTLGVYFLHLFALMLLATFVAPRTGVIPSLLLNFLIIAGVYGACLTMTLLLRHVPVVKKLFEL